MFSIWRCSLYEICFLVACGGYSLRITADGLYLKLKYYLKPLEFLRQIASLNVIIFNTDNLV
jgi:hypothetical protein